MKVSQLVEVTRKLEIPVGEEKLVIVYKPYRFNGGFLTELDELTIIDALIRVIHTWDLEDEDGSPYPLEKEKLELLPYVFLQGVWQAIQDNVFPGNLETRASS